MLHTDVADTNDDALPTPEETALLVPAKRLTRDLSLASVTLTADEARFLVDAYYQMQENRIRADGQVRALNKSAEPHAVLQWLGIQSDTLEQQIKRALAKYAEAQPLGQWALSQIGIGPVITAGLLAHIDFEPWTCAVPKAERTPDHKCTEREPCSEHCGRKRIQTVGHIWGFAGLDPTVTWGKGEKRPWNASLKTLCVHPDVRITTKRGYLPISEIKVGDVVLTHRGRWRPVLEVFENHYEGPLNGLRGAKSGNQIAWLTDGHPVYAAACDTWVSGRTFKRKEATASEFAWHAVENVRERWHLLRPLIEQSLMCLPVIECEGVAIEGNRVAAQGRWAGVPAPRALKVDARIPLTPAVARIVGLYLSEGHVSGTHLCFSFHVKETELQHEISNFATTVGASSTIGKENCNAVQVTINCKPLAEAFRKLFGTGDNKALPMDWLGLPLDVLQGILAGVIDGDGDHVGKAAGKRITVGGANANFARQIQDLARRCGYSASLHCEKGGRAFRIYLNSSPDVHVTARSTLKREYCGPVYNLEVAEDHSYVAEGYAVHNCWKIGESFVKVSGNPKAFYGTIYKQRKELETARNERGEYAEQAKAMLSRKRFRADTQARGHYEAGHLPPAHIHARAKRYAVKLFLAHFFEVGYTLANGHAPPLPYPIAIQGHAHKIDPK